MKNRLFLLLSLIFFSCQPSNTVSTEPDVSAIKDSIDKVFLEWSDQFENLNVDGIMNYMADDDELIWASEGIIIKGRDNIADWMREALSPIDKWNYTNYGKATIYVIKLPFSKTTKSIVIEIQVLNIRLLHDDGLETIVGTPTNKKTRNYSM